MLVIELTSGQWMDPPNPTKFYAFTNNLRNYNKRALYPVYCNLLPLGVAKI